MDVAGVENSDGAVDAVGVLNKLGLVVAPLLNIDGVDKAVDVPNALPKAGAAEVDAPNVLPNDGAEVAGVPKLLPNAGAVLAAGVPNAVPNVGAAEDATGVPKELPKVGACCWAGVPNVEPKPPKLVGADVAGVPPNVKGAPKAVAKKKNFF